MLDALFTPVVAKEILSFRIPWRARLRLARLRRKANDGTLTQAERTEYQEFVDTLDILAELRLRALEVTRGRAS